MLKKVRYKPNVILVTGDSSGIGYACCEHLAARGYTVYGASRTPPDSIAWTHISMDVTDEASVRSAAASLLEHESHVDAIIHCAGISLIGPLEETSIAEAQQHFDVNYFGAIRVMQTFLPAMRQHRRGKIIVVGSIGGLIGLPYLSHYSAAKSALNRLIESVRPELRSFGVEATIIHPGDLKTNLSNNRKHSTGIQFDSNYTDEYARYSKFYEQCEAQGRTPDTVALIVERLLNRQHLPARVTTGTALEKLGVLGSRVLPSHVFERIFHRVYAP